MGKEPRRKITKREAGNVNKGINHASTHAAAADRDRDRWIAVARKKKAKIYKRGWKTPAGPLSHASDSDTDSALAFWLCFCLCFFHTEDKQAKSLSPIGGHVCLNDKLLFVNRIK